MTPAKTIFAALALAGLSALPTLAQDLTKMTCSEFLGMDAIGKRDTAGSLLMWIQDSANATAAGKLIAQYESKAEDETWLREGFVIEIEGHCSDAAPDQGVIDRLIEHS